MKKEISWRLDAQKQTSDPILRGFCTFFFKSAKCLKKSKNQKKSKKIKKIKNQSQFFKQHKFLVFFKFQFILFIF